MYLIYRRRDEEETRLDMKEDEDWYSDVQPEHTEGSSYQTLHHYDPVE
jgi:hypothetical protein